MHPSYHGALWSLASTSWYLKQDLDLPQRGESCEAGRGQRCLVSAPLTSAPDAAPPLPADPGRAHGGAQPRPRLLPDPEEHPVHRRWGVRLHCQQHHRPGLPVHVPRSAM